MGMSEIWKTIPGFGGRYEASSEGRIRSLFGRGQWAHQKLAEPYVLKSQLSTSSYYQVNLQHNKKIKRCTVHSLVLQAFQGPRPEGYDGAHLNGNNKDNRNCNLKWTTTKENNLHKRLHGTDQVGERNGNTKLTEKQVLEIHPKLVVGRSAASLAKEYGVSAGAILNIGSGRTWQYLKLVPLPTRYLQANFYKGKDPTLTF